MHFAEKWVEGQYLQDVYFERLVEIRDKRRTKIIRDRAENFSPEEQLNVLIHVLPVLRLRCEVFSARRRLSV